MKRWLRFTIIFWVLVGILLLQSSVSITSDFEGTVVGSDGKPIEGAFVFYGYSGSNFLHGSYYRLGSIIRTEENGHFLIPAAVHLHLPAPFQGSTELFNIGIYSSRSHMMAGSVGAGKLLLNADVEGEYKVDPTARRIEFHDASNYPAAWFRSLDMMLAAMEEMVNTDWAHVNAPVATKRALLDAVVDDIKHFKTRHGDALYVPTRDTARKQATYEAAVHLPVLPGPRVGQDRFGDYLNRGLRNLEAYAEGLGADLTSHSQKPMIDIQSLAKTGEYVPKSPEEAISRCIASIQRGLSLHAKRQPALVGIEDVQPEWNRLRFEATVGESHCLVYVHFWVLPPGAKHQPFNDEGEPISWITHKAEGCIQLVLSKNGKDYGKDGLLSVVSPDLGKLKEELGRMHVSQ